MMSLHPSPDSLFHFPCQGTVDLSLEILEKLGYNHLDRTKMLTLEQEENISARAYVPEHLVSLMGPVSKGDPFLLEEHLGFSKDNWLILVGYPLDGEFSQGRCEGVLKQVLETFRPEYLWFVGPEIPASLLKRCTERQTDRYYKLDLEETKRKDLLQRVVEKASKELKVERAEAFSKEHEGLVAELLKREKLPPRIKELYRAMPDYVSQSPGACVLNARDRNGKLNAFYVVDLSAKTFSTYVLGAYSKKYYIPHASDFLFSDMINLTREHGKSIIQLGLGVNEGIRRFKEKWGGVPSLKYEFCECHYGRTRTVSLIRDLEGKL